MAANLELAGRWQPRMVLKRDVFSTIERGQFAGPDGPVEAVMRRIDEVPWWAWPVARHFLKREARGLAIAGPLGIAPTLLHLDGRCLVRGFLYGTAMHVARPVGDADYFRAARRALHDLHRAGICHNDLAKEQNWLRGPRGEAYMTDFQLAARFRRGSRLFRIAAYEDLRHLLKHKRRYVPEALTAAERRVVGRKSALNRLWMATGKRVYWWITRRLKLEDREGGGVRTSRDAPAALAELRRQPGVRDALIVPLTMRSGGPWLYAFVEGDSLDEVALHAALDRALGADASPDFIQVAPALPRRAAGELRADILQRIPANEVADLDRMDLSAAERQLAARLLAERKEYGYGPRHSKDAPAIAACLERHPQVREAVVVSFPHQVLVTGLYAFVAGDGLEEPALRAHVTANAAGRKPPELIQIVPALPRDGEGAVRTDLLKDIAMNELDRIGAYTGSEQAVLAAIVAGRKIIRDL